MPVRDLPPPPPRQPASTPAATGAGLGGLPAHLSRPKTVAEWQVGYDARKAQYAIDDAREEAAAQANQVNQQAQAARDPSLEVQGYHPGGFAGVLDTAGQAIGATGHALAQFGNDSVAHLRTFGNYLTSNLDAALPSYVGPDGRTIIGTDPNAPAPAPAGPFVPDDITQRYLNDAQSHGEAINAYPSPTAQVVGHGTNIVANIGTAIANPPLAFASGFGGAKNEGYSDLGATGLASLNLIPGGFGKGAAKIAEQGLLGGSRVLPQALRPAAESIARAPVVQDALAQGVIGGAMNVGSAGVTALESDPRLGPDAARQMLGDTGFNGGVGALTGAGLAFLTRGRGTPRPYRPGEVPPSIAAPRPDIQPEFRASTVSADPVLTEGYGNINLPQIVRGEFAQTGSRPTVGPDGLPLGNPGEFTQTGSRPTVGPDGLPAINRGELVQTAELPGEGFYKAESAPPTPEGFNQFNAAPPTPEGFYRAQPRRPDIQPQRNDPTSLGEAAIIHPTEVGDTSPVEVPPSWELPGKFDRRPGKTQANDPFGENLDARANAPSETDLAPVEPAQPDPFSEYHEEPHKIGAMGRMDKSLPDTELQLDPVAQRAEQATEQVAPFIPEVASHFAKQRAERDSIRPEYSSDTTKLDLPITPAKPGLRHLSQEAQNWVMNDLKPGERELLRGAITERGKQNDQAGDLGNLQQELVFLRDKRDKKPGARPKGVAPVEGAPVPRPTSTRAEADLVQGGFRRQGEPTPPPVDTTAPTERIAKPVAPGVPGTHTLYHGTSRAGFTNFDPYGGEYGLMGEGTYFTDSKNVGRKYMKKGKGGSPGLYEAKVTVKNPLDMDAPADHKAWLSAISQDPAMVEGRLGAKEQGYAHQPEESAVRAWEKDLADVKTNEDVLRLIESHLADGQTPAHEGRETVTSLIRAMGHDSVTHIGGGRHGLSEGEKHRVYIALDPEQVTDTRQIEGGAKPAAPEAPAKPTTPGRFGLRPPDNSRQGALNVSDPLEALGKGIAKVGSKAAEPVIGAVKTISHVAKGLDKPYSKPLVDVVRDLPGGKAAAEKADKTLSYGKELVGKFESGAQVALKAVTKGPKARAARASLDEVNYRGKLGFARINEVLDGAIPARPAEEPFRKAMHSLTYRTGLHAERDGYTINVGDKQIPFKADPARQRSPRVATQALRYFSERPSDPESMALAKDIAADPRNAGLKPEDVYGEFKAWSQRGMTKRGMAEDARTIKAFPTHWRTPEGKVVQLLETDPHTLIRAVSKSFPERIAFRKVFGPEAVPKEFADLEANSGNEGKTAGENLFRTLNGMRLHDSLSDFGDKARPGSVMEAVRDWTNFPYQALKDAHLSMAWLSNIPETLGKPRALSGNANYLKAVKDVLSPGKARQAIMEDLASRGAITRDVLDWYVNKSNLAETATRFVRNTLSAPRHAVDEFNERVAARSSQLWSEGLQKGDGNGMDRIKLALMNYTPEQTAAILKGGFSDRVLSDITRRATVNSQSLKAHPAERSRLGNSPAWTTWTIGDQYAQQNQNRNLRLWGQVAKEAMDPNAPFGQKVKATAAALGHAGNSAGGQLAAAAMTLAARAMIYGGGVVLADKALGSPAGLEDFLIDAFKTAFIGGPAQAVVNTITAANGKVTDDIVRPFVPVSTLQEVRDALYATGKYDGMSGAEAAGKFLSSSLAVTPMLANVMAITGMKKDDTELDASIKAFRKWESEYAPSSRVIPAASPDGFRTAMRKAADAIQKGTDPSEALMEALGTRKASSAAESLRGKRILPSENTPKGKADRAKALEYLGPATLSKLEQYDHLLEVWARRIHPPE